MNFPLRAPCQHGRVYCLPCGLSVTKLARESAGQKGCLEAVSATPAPTTHGKAPGRPREFRNAAERQRAYRARKAAA